MEKKKLQNLKNRIRKANVCLTALGDLVLMYEIDAMTRDEKLELREFLASGKIPTKYEYLEKSIG